MSVAASVRCDVVEPSRMRVPAVRIVLPRVPHAIDNTEIALTTAVSEIVLGDRHGFATERH